MSADELVKILQRTIEEQGSAFRQFRPETDEKTRTLTELQGTQQDVALLASLKTYKVKQMFIDYI